MRRTDELFKVPSRLETLQSLNAGLSDYSQIGKFLTVYPRSTSCAVTLARELHRVTKGLAGPKIPFDERYRRNSLVHYRYGAFRPSSRSQVGVIRTPTGRRYADQRASGRAVPHWEVDPFKKTRGRIFRLTGPIGRDFLVLKAKMQRGKGGVYEAIDISASPAELVIIKEGRRHGETDWDGQDGYARVRHEGVVLRALRKAGVPVPEIRHEFVQNGRRYLALEKIEGRPLIPLSRTHPSKISWRRAAKILETLEPFLSRMHETGWVWRDCKPSHIFLDRGSVRLIDFEGACRINDGQALPWNSLNYAPPVRRSSFRRRVGVIEDTYALGVIVFQFALGRFPPASKTGRETLYRRNSIPGFLQIKMERLLALGPSR
jgi:hypothetical protein